MWNLRREEQLILLFLIAAFVVGLGIKLLGGIPTSPPPPPPPLIGVKIYGAVKEPGWYRIPEGSPLQELIERARGPLPWANLSKIDLSHPILSSTAVHIPEGKMDLNRASVHQLTYLPGIGPELAKRIVNYRNKRGKFSTLSQLKEVPGIGEIRFQKIKDKLIIKNGEVKSE